MVVDDSAVIRGLLTRTLESDGGIAVVVSAGNGRMALDALKRHDIELVLLDVAMPVMDGITAVPLLLAARPGLRIIIVSSLSRRGAAVTLKALAAGAADYVVKPTAATLAAGDAFRRELIAKVKALGEAHRGTGVSRRAPKASPARYAGEVPQALAIGASTGGPMALYRIVAALAKTVWQPIFITQHMPPAFTGIFAAHLARVSGLPAAEAIEGEPVEEGRIYVAPGDHHMTVESAGARRIRLSKGPAENYCRPSVDPMLRSLAASYGSGLLCAILTGMGHDGLVGAAAVVAAGGTVVAQDQATSIVWGMPGSVVAAGLASQVLPLDGIAPFLVRAATGAAP